jgi:hypothetical protein
MQILRYAQNDILDFGDRIMTNMGTEITK